MNLLREEGEQADRYRRRARWTRYVAWGMTGFFVVCLGLTAYGYMANRIPLRPDVAIVAIGFFGSPMLAMWWIHEILMRSAVLHTNRALRLQIKLMQTSHERTVEAQCPDENCEHCRTLKVLAKLRQPLRIKADES